jgi:MoaA/NifB/PqqE/SkfB family radical SAM enzyme
MGLDNVQSPCGRQSIRFNPRGQIIPCVYWPANGNPRPGITDLPQLGEGVLDTPDFHMARREPTTLEDCACQGGCASRRALNRKIDAHDEYCPWVRGDDITLNWKPAPSVDLMRSGNVCTTIVM